MRSNGHSSAPPPPPPPPPVLPHPALPPPPPPSLPCQRPSHLLGRLGWPPRANGPARRRQARPRGTRSDGEACSARRTRPTSLTGTWRGYHRAARQRRRRCPLLPCTGRPATRRPRPHRPPNGPLGRCKRRPPPHCQQSRWPRARAQRVAAAERASQSAASSKAFGWAVTTSYSMASCCTRATSSGSR